MNTHNLTKYVESFQKLKEKLMDQKLTESDAALLASRLMEIPQSIPSSLLFKIKQNDSFIPYVFVGTGLTIKKIEVSKRGDPSLSLVISLKSGLDQKEIKLARNQALYFLTLLSLKFNDFEADAIGGFEYEVDTYSAELAKKLGINYRTFSNDDIENLKRKLSELNFNQAIQRGSRKARLSVPPNHIAFSPQAREVFESITDSTLEGFQKRYMDQTTF